MFYNVADIQSALQCISSNVDQDKKTEALHYLEQFQKSAQAWAICTEVLSGNESTGLEFQIFASQTLRSKVTYDLTQLSGEQAGLKDTIIRLILLHSNKLVITQLSVALARLAIQYIQWTNPVTEIIASLNAFPAKLLEFLKILPEETLDMGSVPLSEDEFNSRIHELIASIGEEVLKYLIVCVETMQSQASESQEVSLGQILRCLSSWCFEFPIEQLLTVQPLIEIIFKSLLNGNEQNDIEAFEAAVDCFCIILKESADVHNEQIIFSLSEQLITLQSKLLPGLMSPVTDVEQDLDSDLLESLTRLFVEAGEAWTVFITKKPQDYQAVVSILLMLAWKNDDLDVVEYTFPFWFNLKQNLVLPRYQNSKVVYTPIYIDLINCLIKRLQYPIEGFSNKEEEDKFKEFRYHIGDVLKDCTAVVGSKKALSQPLEKIKQALSHNKGWQELEAPLFSLRTMAQEVSLTENTLLPQIIDIVVNLPEHPKVRYAAILVLGRYTEWTAKHPETLEVQLQYIFSGFQLANGNHEVLTALSHSLMYFCTDCSEHLSSYIEQLFDFYFNVRDTVDIESQFELCQGLSAVLSKQSAENVAPLFQKLLDINLTEITNQVSNWQTDPTIYGPKIADKIDLIYALFEELKPRYQYPQQGQEPLVSQIESIWKTIRHIMVDAGTMNDTVIVERTTKLLRRLFERFHMFCEPILSSVAEFLVQGYASTSLGTYLWCSGSIIVVFGDDDSLPITPEMKMAVWKFALTQCSTFMINFKGFDVTRINDYYELVMDFFAMISDLVMFYPKEFLMSTELLTNVVDVSIQTVNKLENYDAYIFVLRCLDDIISWGFATPPISTIAIEKVPDEWRNQIMNEVVVTRGPYLTATLLSGLVSNFNENAHSEAIGCIVKLFRLITEYNNNDASICKVWIAQAATHLGGVTQEEVNKFCQSVTAGLKKNDYRKVREGIKNFATWYSRKNIESRMI